MAEAGGSVFEAAYTAKAEHAAGRGEFGWGWGQTRVAKIENRKSKFVLRWMRRWACCRNLLKK
jgi:hypothetical protein